MNKDLIIQGIQEYYSVIDYDEVEELALIRKEITSLKRQLRELNKKGVIRS